MKNFLKIIFEMMKEISLTDLVAKTMLIAAYCLRIGLIGGLLVWANPWNTIFTIMFYVSDIIILVGIVLLVVYCAFLWIKDKIDDFRSSYRRHKEDLERKS